MTRFGIVIATMMILWSVLLIPQFMLWNVAGLYNTYVPLTLPAFFLDGFYIFLLRQFFSTLPRDYDEAAIIDGASYFATAGRIPENIFRPEWERHHHVHDNYNAITGEGCDACNSDRFYQWGALLYAVVLRNRGFL